MFGQHVFWRETMKPAKFLIFDGRVVIVLVPAFMHLRLWTLILALSTMMVFWWFDRKGISASSILRYLRVRLIGRKRSARGIYEERVPVDFGFECRLYLQRELAEAARAGGKPTGGLLSRIGLVPAAKARSGGLGLAKGGGNG